MPFKYDPQGSGSEADGAKSTKYCSYCYQDGNFTGDFKTAKEMQDFCIQKLVEVKKYPKIVAWLFTRCIPKMERWKGK